MKKENKKMDYVEGAITPPKILSKEELEKERKKRENEELRKVFKGEKK